MSRSEISGAALAGRPPVSVVMPFAGDERAARAAVDGLLALDLRAGDELILADNSGVAVGRGGAAVAEGRGGEAVAVGRGGAAVAEGRGGEAVANHGGVASRGGVEVVRATGERSPAHARNVGASRAHGEWILFLDADCRSPRDLLDAYFAAPVRDDVGALAGEVVPLPGGETLAARYGAARSFLSQQAHMNHPYRPRAVAANLLVRRAAFEQIGGFYEGVRAAEDTDFSWRLQQAGWRLELRRGARVEHRYRGSLRELRRQWRGYAAGRAWLARRYDEFAPQPAAARALGRLLGKFRRGSSATRPGRRGAPETGAGRLERGRYLALDALLSVEELAGLALSNRPARPQPGASDVVIVADRFPVRGDPLVEFARALDGARVEAAGRPDAPDAAVAGALRIDYREDDGIAARAGALIALTARHPLRAAADLVARAPGEPKLSALAPAALRLKRDRPARVHALGGDEARATARRLARLAGRPLDEGHRRR